jgi:3',5'-cyclic AMP phosphodiesterase CpdA
MTRILHLSDPHFGAADAAVASSFLRRAADLEPDVSILSGDLTMRARWSELALARRFVERLPQPRLVIPGNHDIPALNQPFERFFAPFRRYRRVISEKLEPTFSAPRLHVVSVNSSKAFGFHADWSTGRLSREELRRLDGRLAGPPGTFRVLVLHHPLLAPEVHGRAVVQPLDELLGLLRKHRVDLVLCGHFHQSHLATAGPSIVSQAATVCSTRLQGEPQGFHLIRMTGERVEIDRYVYGGGVFEVGSVFSFIRGGEGWVSEESPGRDEVQLVV